MPRKPSARIPARYAKAASKVDLKTRVAFWEAYCANGYQMEPAAKSTGISETAAWGILFRPPTFRQRSRLAAKAVSLETRQAFLDQLKEGKDFGEARTELGLSLEAACGIHDAAIKTHKVYSMDWTAK